MLIKYASWSWRIIACQGHKGAVTITETDGIILLSPFFVYEQFQIIINSVSHYDLLMVTRNEKRRFHSVKSCQFKRHVIRRVILNRPVQLPLRPQEQPVPVTQYMHHDALLPQALQLYPT